MQLYTIHYSLKHLVSKFDQKGNKTGEEVTLIEQTLTALPHSTAMQYKDLPGFKIEPYTIEPRNRTSSASKHRGYEDRTSRKSAPKPVVKAGPTKTQKAAATGDLAAAVSGGE